VNPSREPSDLTVVATALSEIVDAHPIVDDRITPSRILAADRVRIMHLAFDEGQELREHTAPVPILLQVIAGHFTIDAAGSSLELSPGGLVHLAAGVPHAVTATEPSRLFIVLLDAAKATG